MSSVNFAIRSVRATVVGNMGAPLRTGEDVGDVEVEKVYFSEEPFSFGVVGMERDATEDLEMCSMEYVEEASVDTK